MTRQKIRKMMVIITFLLLPIIIFYFSPYLIVLGAMEGIIVGSFVMFLLLFLTSLFFGRAFCGYVCATGGMQECLMLVSNKKAKGGKLNFIKYFIWVIWICSIILLFVQAGGFKKIDFLFHTNNGISLSEPFTFAIYYGVILLIFVLSMTAGKRAFCHYVCWMAPFMAIGTKISCVLKLPRLQLVSIKHKCTRCRLCSDKCPMSLNVMNMVENDNMKNSECILCGECVEACKANVIKYTFNEC